jgi:hypothetical protein
MAIVDMLLNEKFCNKPTNETASSGNYGKYGSSNRNTGSRQGGGYDRQQNSSNNRDQGGYGSKGSYNGGMDIEKGGNQPAPGSYIETGTDGERIDFPKKSVVAQLNKLVSTNNILEESFTKKLDSVFELGEDDVVKISKHEMDTITEQKLNKWVIDKKKYDELCEEYRKIMQRIEKKQTTFDARALDHETLHELMKVSSFVMNSVHFYQKFKEIDLKINPYDLIYFLSRYK